MKTFTVNEKLRKRFFSKIIKTEGCWKWTGALHRQGYGSIRFFEIKATQLAHRVSWVLHKGPIPEGMCVLHSCDNPPCCNPDHLFLGTQQENIKDMVSKCRQFLDKKGEKSPNSKLTWIEVEKIRKYFADGFSSNQLAKAFGVGRSSILRVVNQQTWFTQKSAP